MSDIAQNPLWYLAYSKPRQEEIARVNLERQGFEAYLPLFKKWRKTPEGLQALLEPMFPRYVFFRPGREGLGLSGVRSTRGVTTLVCFGHEPARVGQPLLDGIRALEEARSQAQAHEVTDLRPGQTVVLMHNALRGLEGLVQSVSAKRVAVLLEILGRPTVVDLAHHQVAANP